MTRKRYIKLLMAHGVPRNVANRGAAHARKHRVPYEADLEFLQILKEKVFHKVTKELERAILCGDGIQFTGMSNDFLVRPRMDIKPLPAAPVVVIPGASFIDWKDINWPTPQPQPAAGCLYAIDTTPPEDTGEQWTKNDALDALRYAVEAIYNRQQEVLGR